MTTEVIEVVLTIAEQRKVIEHIAGESCFRMWITPTEFAAYEKDQRFAGRLSDGRFFIWRPRSEITKLQRSSSLTDRELAKLIQQRIIEDHET